METHCAYVVFKCLCQASGKPAVRAERTRHVQYCTNTQHVKYTYTHTHTHITSTRASSTSRGYWARGTKLIPSILSWSQRNDLKTTFLIILSHQIKRTLRLSMRKKKKKRVLPLTQKGFLKASTSAQTKFRTIMTDCTSYENATRRAVTLYYALSHRTWLKKPTTFTFPASRYGRFAL